MATKKEQAEAEDAPAEPEGKLAAVTDEPAPAEHKGYEGAVPEDDTDYTVAGQKGK